MYEYNAVVLDQYRDGDSFYADIDYGMRQHGVWEIRVRSLWCAERYTIDGERATTHSFEIMPVGTNIRIKTYKTSKGMEASSAGRWIADVYLPDGSSFAERMIADGYGTASKG